MTARSHWVLLGVCLLACGNEDAPTPTAGGHSGSAAVEASVETAGGASGNVGAAGGASGETTGGASGAMTGGASGNVGAAAGASGETAGGASGAGGAKVGVGGAGGAADLDGAASGGTQIRDSSSGRADTGGTSDGGDGSSDVPISLDGSKPVRILVYSLIAAQRTVGTPVCQADGTQCDYSVKQTATGYVHASIPAGNEMLKRLAAKHHFELKLYEGSMRDAVAREFTPEGLSTYQAIVFLNPNGLGLSATQRDAFKRYISQGGAFVGIHAASNCETDWPWFHDFVGAFETGVVGVSAQTLTVVPGISTEHLAATWPMLDEWLKHSRSVDTQPNIKVLLRRSGDPVAWYQESGGGRMWYTGLGHLASTFANADFEQHVWGGIRWATRLP